MIETPYLLFLGDAPDQLAVKVAQGIKDWRPDNAVGQLRMEGCKADVGLPDMTLAQAKEAGAKTMVIGVANRGGTISAAWRAVLVDALEAGFDLASGLHNLLRNEPELVAAAQRAGRKLHDVHGPGAGRGHAGKRDEKQFQGDRADRYPDHRRGCAPGCRGRRFYGRIDRVSDPR